MKRMINMTDYWEDTDRYKDAQDLADFVREFECDGLEYMHYQGGKEEFFPKEMVTGLHMRYYNEWLDLWKGDMEALRREYDSLEQAEKVFGTLDRRGILETFQDDLERARKLEVSYVVFHVSNVRLSEVFSYDFSCTDEEVVDAVADMVNQLLDGKGYEFEFLLENLWWPGLTLTRPEITKRLLDQIHYPKKGIMLDTGHLMHTNLDLKTQEEAVDYILEKVQEHGELASYIRGMHLNQSLTGDYVKGFLGRKDAMPKTYRDRMAASFSHVFQIDSHFPFTTPRVKELVEKIQPEYLTFELLSGTREEHEEKLRQQLEAFR